MSDDTTEGGFTDEEIAAMAEIANRIDETRDRINALMELKDSLTAELRARLKPTEKPYRLGTHRVTVHQSTEFNPELAAKVIAPELLPLVTVTTTTISEEMCKAILPPLAYQACRSPRGKATVTVK
jgi:hypothetical protein